MNAGETADEGTLICTAKAAQQIVINEEAERTLRLAQARLLDSVGMMLVDRRNPSSLANSSWSTAWLGSSASDLAFRLSLLSVGDGMDDFDEETRGHPGSVIVPALFAATVASHGSRVGAVSGMDLLSGLVVGYQLMAGLGRVMGAPRIHALGYLPSAILGAPGAALAVGRAWGADVRTLASSMGIGASVACGINEFDEADVLRAFQGAWASRSGFEAARLAMSGLVPSMRALEAKGGLIRHLVKDDEPIKTDLMDGDLAVERAS